MKLPKLRTHLLGAGLFACLLPGVASAGSITVFTTDFESGPVAEISGAGGIESTQGLSGFGFDNSFYRNASAQSGGSGSYSTVLTLSGLQSHTSIDLNFFFAALDSWDIGNPYADVFNVLVDGTAVLTDSFAANGSGTYAAPGGSEIFLDLPLYSGTPHFNEAAYDMGPLSNFTNIAHTGSDLTIEFFTTSLDLNNVGGTPNGWSGGTDESFALDNIEIILNGIDVADVPEPATNILLGLGLLTLGLRQRKLMARV